MKNEVFEDYTELTAKQFAVMNYRYTMISGIIPIVEDKKKLGRHRKSKYLQSEM